MRPWLTRTLNICLLVAVVVVIGYVNESGSDAASQLTLLGLVLGSAVLGYLWGRWWWLPAVVVGSTVALEHIGAVALGAREPGIHLPPGVWGFLSLFILIVPTLIAGFAGALVRRLVSPPPSSAPRSSASG
jgi:hypothetical protein